MAIFRIFILKFDASAVTGWWHCGDSRRGVILWRCSLPAAAQDLTSDDSERRWRSEFGLFVIVDVIRRQLVTTAVLSRQLKVRQLVVDWSDLMTMTRLLHVLLVAHLQSYRALMWQYQPSSKFLYSILISDYVNVSIIAFAFMKTVTVNRPWRHVHCYNDVTFIVAMTSCSLLQWRHVHC